MEDIMIPICLQCRKTLKTENKVIVVDNRLNEVVHEDCYIDYILKKHTSESYNYDELMELRKENYERLQKQSDRFIVKNS